jgi:hypothetical protein
MTPEASSLVITALGGALGALVLRSAIKLSGAVLARRRPLAIYECANVEESGLGNLRHDWGREVADSASKSGKAWEYDSRFIERHNRHVTREHTIFGPYLNDFGKPGFYRVCFRICGKGFTNTDEPVIALDVVQARFGTDRTLRLLGQKIVRAKELSGKYQRFNIICHAPGTGVYEYRCAVVPKGVILENRSIRFDRISVYSHPQIWDAL